MDKSDVSWYQLESMKELIQKFYAAFDKGDWETMATCYDADVTFTDEVFVSLKGKEVMAMWRMLLERSKGNLTIHSSDIEADEKKGKARWTAEYYFSATGRKVINKILAEFEFKNGKIIRHKDSFSLHRWASQAMGFKGRLFGGFGFFRKKVQQTARQSLEKYMLKNEKSL